MCTSLSFSAFSHYFGRNLDLEYCYDETVTVTPRNYPFSFRREAPISSHYAMIGVATVAQDYPLYYEATNEAGLSIAGLHFPGNAHYPQNTAKPHTVAPFELIPWILSQCGTVLAAKKLLEQTNIAPIPFSAEYPISPLHWFVCDEASSVTVEPGEAGLNIMDNPYGVLTNNPRFAYHTENIKNYMQLNPYPPENRLVPELKISPYSRGLGAWGLPGDLSSASRFVRCVYTKFHSVKPNNEPDSVNQFFHILRSVSQQEGCVVLDEGLEKTVYTSCCNTKTGVFYYTTYGNSHITRIDMGKVDLQGTRLTNYPLIRKPNFFLQN